MRKYKIAFIINPVSGGGLGRRVHTFLPEIMASFGYHEGEWTSCYTKKDTMVEQIQYLLANACKIIAVGGDGTIGLVLNQLNKGYTHGEVGLIPLGTGNDLGRALGIHDVYHSKGLLACIKRLIRAKFTQFDLWKVNTNYTLAAYLSMGMDAAILHDFDSARKSGKLFKSAIINKCYYILKLFSRLSYRMQNPVQLEISLCGNAQTVELKNSVGCIIGNINSYASGAKPFCNGNFNDKLLDIIVFQNIFGYFMHSLASRIAPVLAGKTCRFVQSFQADRVKISGIEADYIQIDGEDLTGTFAREAVILEPKCNVKFLDLRKRPFNIF
ncbi:MAG: hypothetical protein HQK83_06075 [Fibrobacteria bacterium]|nr:hypothetical protein [Fibrobacteria bacterium]